MKYEFAEIIRETVLDKPYLAQVPENARNNGIDSGFMSFFCWKEDKLYTARKDSMFLVLSVMDVRPALWARSVEVLKVVDPEGKIRILDRYTVEEQEFLVPVKLTPEDSEEP
jgi:hypothetical protein